ncbi:tRNA dihydrouridine(20/20a) synthase DusA [Sagittula sp. NFXS13]|uniref:tRNA dihydrouridine(20/20a) synthase DusA n=1 Tax=Sagittula sp. NFXS13 TaxID=2819095 RepID=UPI0032DEA44F
MKQGNCNVADAARLSVAPMMDWTDRHCRYFHRLMSTRTLLYTEMVTAPALVRGGALHLLDFDPEEHPVALQLGGSDAQELAQAARLGAQAGYDEVNLNCGCPSDRVQSGTFGAVLMKYPETVVDCIKAVQDAVDVDVTVKCRIGVDDQDPEIVLPDFLERLQRAGCTRVTIHARKAWLQGLSPKENRDVPPLDYDLVRRMRTEFPNMHLSVNGGIRTLAETQGFLHDGLDGVMIGRVAYHQPWDILGKADALWGDTPHQTREEVVARMLPYIAGHIAKGGKLNQVTRHMLGLFAGRPGARRWRQILSTEAHKPGAGPGVVEDALAAVLAEAA